MIASFQGANNMKSWFKSSKIKQFSPEPSPSYKYKNAYYEQFKTVFFVLRLYARFFIKKIPNGRGEFESPWRSWLAVYCIVSYTAQTYIAISDTRNRINKLNAEDSYDRILFDVLVLSYQQIHYHLPFTYWMDSKPVAEYLNMWMRFQDEWNTTFGKSLVLKTKIYNDCFTVVIIVSLVLIVGTENIATLNDPWHHMLPYLFTLGSTGLVLLIWHNTSSEIASLIDTMRQELLEKISVKPDKMTFYRWRKLWLSLDAIVSSLGHNFSLVMLSIFFSYAISFLLSLYNCQTLFYMNIDFMMVLGYFWTGLVSVTFIFVICNASTAIQKARNATSKHVLQIKLSTLERETVSEIDAVLYTISNHALEIDLLGLVTVTRKLFMSFLSNIITYLIVILQFKK